MAYKRKRCSVKPEEEIFSVVKQQKLEHSSDDYVPDFYFRARANIASNPDLWPHQKEAYRKVHEFICANGSTTNLLLIVLPTGTGKSGIAHILPFGLKGRVLMITHNTDSCHQLMNNEDFLYRRSVLSDGTAGPKIHVVQNQDDMIHLRKDYSDYDLFIANIQKFDFGGKWKDTVGQFFQLIIIDEGHHIPAKTYNNVVMNQLTTNTNINIVLLTATPNRRDKLPLNANIVFEYCMKQAIEEKLIKHPCLVTYTPEYISWSENGRNIQRRIAGANTCQLKRRINQTLLNSKEVQTQLLAMMVKLIEEKRRETGVHHQAIVVCATQSQVDQVTKELNRNFFVLGKPMVALSYHCELSSSQRLHVQQEMKSNRHDVVVHCGLLNEGHDCPTISITVVLCKVKWVGRFSQVVGRSIRYLHDKSLTDNTAHIIMNHHFVGKLWDQYKAEAQVLSDKPQLPEHHTTSAHKRNRTVTGKNQQNKQHITTNTHKKRESCLTDRAESSKDENTNEEHTQFSPDRICSVEITPNYWNYDSLLCNTASGKEVVRTTEMIVSRKCTNPSSPLNYSKHNSRQVINVDHPNNDEVLLGKEEDSTNKICEHKEKSFGPSCSRCEYLPTDRAACQHETDILIIHCRTCNKINKVPLY